METGDELVPEPVRCTVHTRTPRASPLNDAREDLEFQGREHVQSRWRSQKVSVALSTRNA